PNMPRMTAESPVTSLERSSGAPSSTVLGIAASSIDEPKAQNTEITTTCSTVACSGTNSVQATAPTTEPASKAQRLPNLADIQPLSGAAISEPQFDGNFSRPATVALTARPTPA